MYAAGNTNFLFVNLTIHHSEENLDSSRSRSFFLGGERETILCLPNSSQGLFFHLESMRDCQMAMDSGEISHSVIQ